MGFKRRKPRGKDLLKTVPPEELEQVETLSFEEIEEALRRGAEERKKAERALPMVMTPRGRYRGFI